DGGLESDTLDGGAGVDTLTGGTGDDTFTFSNLTHSTSADPDRITDWDNGTDLIDLSALSITGIGAGANQVTITEVGGNTYVSHNSSTFQIRLDGIGYALAAGDFIFGYDFTGTSGNDTLTG